MDNSGSLNAQVIHQLTSRLRSKVAFQVNFGGPPPKKKWGTPLKMGTPPPKSGGSSGKGGALKMEGRVKIGGACQKMGDPLKYGGPPQKWGTPPKNGGTPQKKGDPSPQEWGEP